MSLPKIFDNGVPLRVGDAFGTHNPDMFGCVIAVNPERGRALVQFQNGERLEVSIAVTMKYRDHLDAISMQAARW